MVPFPANFLMGENPIFLKNPVLGTHVVVYFTSPYLYFSLGLPNHEESFICVMQH